MTNTLIAVAMAAAVAVGAVGHAVVEKSKPKFVRQKSVSLQGRPKVCDQADAGILQKARAGQCWESPDGGVFWVTCYGRTFHPKCLGE